MLKNTISHLQERKHEPVKQLKIITQQTKNLGKPNIFDIKSVIIEHPKVSNKLFKTIRRAEKVSQVGSNSSFYSDTKK